MRPSPFSSLAILALLISGSLAQVDNSKVERVWSSVAWVYYGDRTPIVSMMNPATLTPLGAHQLRSQGATVRDRYLVRPGADPDQDVDDIVPIVGVSRNAIDNSQLSIFSTTDSYVVGSALAFLQGLYPPITQAFPNATGGMEAASLANGSVLNYPLEGYQYPNIRTFSRYNDPESIWLQGSAHCPKYMQSTLYPSNDSFLSSVNDGYIDFYRKLYNHTFKEAFTLANTNVYNAYNLYDYANYKYTHSNESDLTMDDVAQLRSLASLEQRWRHGDSSLSGVTSGDQTRAIAGRTMASKVMSLFLEHIRSGGARNKINLMFSSFEPFVAFFALARLMTGPSALLFNPLPYGGATMLFELFSVGDENDAGFPGMENLNVRFLYRNGTDEASKFRVYSIFDNVVAYPDMKFTQFAKYMDGVGVTTIRNWCSACDSSAFFCGALDGDDENGWQGSTGGRSFWGGDVVRGGGLSPPAAGVVGAVVALAVTGLALLGAMVLGGLRFHKADPKTAKMGSVFGGAGGGFKGAEKKEDDADVEFAKGGVKRERVGSWELRDGGGNKASPPSAVEPVSPMSSSASVTGAGATVVAPDLIHPSRHRFGGGGDDDGLSVYGHEPVKPREF